MFKRAIYFFGKEDEEEVSQALRDSFPLLRFVDGHRWPSADPPIAEGIHCCGSSLVYLWPSDLVPKLPSKQLSQSEFQGPSSGPVIQFCRCAQKDRMLELGQLSAYIEDPHSPLGKSHARLVAFLKRRYTCKVDSYSSQTGKLLTRNIGGYLVGKFIQTDPVSAPRLVPAFGRDDYLVPSP